MWFSVNIRVSSLLASSLFPFHLVLLAFTNLIKETLAYHYVCTRWSKKNLKNEENRQLANEWKQEKKIWINCIIILSAKLQRAFLHLIVKYVHRVYYYHLCAVPVLQRRDGIRALKAASAASQYFHSNRWRRRLSSIRWPMFVLLKRIAFHMSCSTTLYGCDGHNIISIPSSCTLMRMNPLHLASSCACIQSVCGRH